MTKTTTFDAAHYLDSEAMIAEYLNQALLSGDSDVLLRAIADVAKAKGITQIAQDSGLGRESLYKALAIGAKPRFQTIFKVLNALGVQLQATSKPSSREHHPVIARNEAVPVAHLRKAKRGGLLRASQ